MKKIYEWALKQIHVPTSVINAVSMLHSDHAERFVEVAVSCNIDDDDVPQEFYHEDKLYKLISCNYVLDKIVYETVDTSYRYFDNQENANKYALNGNYSWNQSSSEASDKYPIKGAWIRPCEHETNYERWFTLAGVKFE